MLAALESVHLGPDPERREHQHDAGVERQRNSSESRVAARTTDAYPGQAEPYQTPNGSGDHELNRLPNAHHGTREAVLRRDRAPELSVGHGLKASHRYHGYDGARQSEEANDIGLACRGARRRGARSASGL